MFASSEDFEQRITERWIPRVDRVPRQLLRHAATRALDDPDAPDIVLEIELDGAQQVKQQYPEAILIFVAAAVARGAGTPTARAVATPTDKVHARLRKAEKEEPIGRELADYVVVNDELERHGRRDDDDHRT